MNENPHKSEEMASHRLQWNVPIAQFRDFQAAMERYEFTNNAQFLEACVSALIRSNRENNDLSRPLRFQPVIPKTNGGLKK